MFSREFEFFFVENILKKFSEICSEKRGELKAEIKSAKELSKIEIERIKYVLTKHPIRFLEHLNYHTADF